MLPLEDITVYEAFARAKDKYPDNQALVYKSEAWTYSEFDRCIDTYAKRFLNIGVKNGTHVGIWCDNTPEFLFSVFALSKIGAVAVLMNTGLHKKEMQKLVNLADVEFLLVGDGYKDTDFRAEAADLINILYGLRNVVYIGELRDSAGIADLFDYGECSDDLLSETRKAVNPSDDGYILFTSGTAMLPRAVLGSHSARANMGLIQGKDLETKPSDRFCVTMPMFHCFCFSVNVMAALFYGACLCLPESIHSMDVLETVQKERCTVMSAVPSFFHTLVSKETLDEFDYSSLRAGFIGGSSYSTSLFDDTELTLGMTLLSSLGQTEASGAITTTNLDDSLEVRSQTVGHFIDNTEYKIAENDEVCIRGFNVMRCYYKDPDGTKRVLDDEGWLHTGDSGFVSEDGNLILTGRIKEFIIRGGENISPLEIESVLYDVEGIAESKAVGVYDPHYGEEVCLCVVKDSKTLITEKDIREILKGSIGEYKVPKYILFMEEFPKSISGKVIVRNLKRKASDILGIT